MPSHTPSKRQAWLAAWLFRGAGVLLLLAAGWWLTGWLLHASAPRRGATDAHQTVDASTRFEYPVIFTSATSEAVIETWRRHLLAATHVSHCPEGHPCVSRALRWAQTGPVPHPVIGFDFAVIRPRVERLAHESAAVDAAHIPIS